MRRWLVEGDVQGVGYRWFIQRQASALGVRGWVANLPDGSVEVVVAGDPAAVASLEAIVRRGPRGARVSRVTESDVPHEAVDTKSFIIKR